MVWDLWASREQRCGLLQLFGVFGATKDTMGHADGNGEIDDVHHKEGRELMMLHQWAN